MDIDDSLRDRKIAGLRARVERLEKDLVLADVENVMLQQENERLQAEIKNLRGVQCPSA